MQVSSNTVAIAAVSFLAGGVAIWIWDRPTDFYTCTLREMRGQPINMRNVAVKVCRDRFGKDGDVE